MEKQSPILEAIKIHGSQQRLAEALLKETGRECSQQQVSKWVKSGQVPVRWITPIESVSGIPARRFLPNHK